MAQTDNIGLNIISPTDDMSVSEFFQKIAGNSDDSNMIIIDAMIQALDDGKLSLGGGTLTGNLSLLGDPVNNSHAVNKGYVDGLIGDIASVLDEINGEVV